MAPFLEKAIGMPNRRGIPAFYVYRLSNHPQ
jgi:hypothetical protein